MLGLKFDPNLSIITISASGTYLDRSGMVDLPGNFESPHLQLIGRSNLST